MFRFCRIIEDRGQQYLLRAANHTSLVCQSLPPGPASALTIDTWTSDGGDWDNLRLLLHWPDQLTMLLALECFGKEHARDARRLMAAAHAHQLTRREQLAGAQRIGESVTLAIRRKYGPVY